MRARRTRAAKSGSLFRGHRAGDTGELEPIRAEIPDEVPFAIPSDPVDAEAVRYAPRAPGRFTWLRRLLGIAVVVGVVWVIAATAWAWSQDQYFVGEQDGTVVIFRGLDASLPGLDLSEPYETTNVELDRLSDFEAQNVREGIDASSLADAHKTVESLAEKMGPAEASAETGAAP
jgi:protein phosphatase